MSNNNMINPANYYNPFAKYNYISKTRGVYIPRNTEPLLDINSAQSTEKSTSIYSENYDAEADIMQSINGENSSNQSGVIGFINKFFG